MTRIEIATRIVAVVIVTPIGREMEPYALTRWAYEVADEILKQDAQQKSEAQKCKWEIDMNDDRYSVSACGCCAVNIKVDPFVFCPFCGKEIAI